MTTPPSRLLTLARDLRRRRARERQNLFVAEGIRAVEELLASSFKVRGALVTEQLGATPRGEALLERLRANKIAVGSVTERDFASAAETESPQGVLAIASVPRITLADLPRADDLRLLVLDAVQDPGNVGTILRTAAAFRVTATVALAGTVDLWNAKVVRSAMGAHFHHACLSGTWDELDTFRRDRGLEVWAADVGGDSIATLKAPAKLALVVGNEGAGLSLRARASADRVVSLPMSAGVESLNVAVAAGILLYELCR